MWEAAQHELSNSPNISSARLASLRQRFTIGVIYARYSEGGYQTDQSLEGQVRECLIYAREHNILILREYREPHISGRNAENRPKFQEMIKDSERREFSVVVVWKMDRFARNRYDSARYKERLHRNDVKLVYAAESIPDSAEGIILESVLEGMAEYYSIDLKQKISRGMRESAYKCKALGTPPLGLKVGDDRHYAIDEETAPFVRQIFRDYVNGDSLQSIADRANALGIRTSRGNLLKIGTITKIISNEKYIGVYEYAPGGIRVDDAFPALIEKEVFYAAQSRRDSQRNGSYTKKNLGGKAKRTYLLSGLIFCGECGASLVGETVVKRRGTEKEVSHSYYVCSNRKRKTGDPCSKTGVPCESIERLVMRAIHTLLLQETILEVLLEEIKKIIASRTYDSEQLKVLKQRRKKAKTAVSNIVNAMEQGNYSPALMERLNQLELEVAALDKQIIKCQQVVNPSDYLDRLRWLLTQYQPTEDVAESYWNDLISCFINSVTCSENGQVCIRFNFFGHPDPGKPFLGMEMTTSLGEKQGVEKGNQDKATVRIPSPNLHHTMSTVEQFGDKTRSVQPYSIFQQYQFYYYEHDLIIVTQLPDDENAPRTRRRKR